jgi:predicted O-methyltransferase YrrM
LLTPSGYPATNIETISYDRFFEGHDSYDLIIGYLGMCSYLPNVLQKIIERVKKGGILIMHNAADFGAAYRSDSSVGTTAMTEIVDSGLFDVYHYASTVSFALCIKK